MSLPSADFSATVAALGAADLNHYINALHKKEPYDFRRSRPYMLQEFILRCASELPPADALKPSLTSAIAQLNARARQSLVDSFLMLPSGELQRRFALAVGTLGMKALLAGNKPGGMAGAAAFLSSAYLGKNETQSFRQFWALAILGKLKAPPTLSNYTCVMVPGFIGNQMPGYLDVNARALTTWGMDVVTAHGSFDTAASSQANAADLLIYIRRVHQEHGRKRLVLFGHSKAGRDLAELFATSDHATQVQLREMVAGIILLQPALTSQIATDIVSHDVAEKRFADLLRRVANGNVQAIRDLAFDDRALTRLREHPWPGDEIPTLVFGSTYEGSLSLVELGQRYLKATHGYSSDGMVPIVEQLTGFAGADWVFLPGIADHMMTGMTWADAFASLTAPETPAAVNVYKNEAAKTDQLDALSKVMPGGHLAAKQVRRALVRWQAAKAQWSTQARQDLIKAGEKIDRAAWVLRSRRTQPAIAPDVLSRALVALLLDRLTPGLSDSVSRPTRSAGR
jgi:hypothetical protein